MYVAFALTAFTPLFIYCSANTGTPVRQQQHQAHTEALNMLKNLIGVPTLSGPYPTDKNLSDVLSCTFTGIFRDEAAQFSFQVLQPLILHTIIGLLQNASSRDAASRSDFYKTILAPFVEKKMVKSLDFKPYPELPGKTCCV